MRRFAIQWLRRIDRALVDAALRHRRERPALLAFLLHALFEDRRELERGFVDPNQPLLVSELRHVIEYFLEHGYRFVTPMQIADGLDAAGHHALLTFDDGYANNLLALPVLREFAVPATFFVATNFVIEGKAFWWDALYRARARRGAAAEAIKREQTLLKRKPYREIEAYVRGECGTDGLTPAGDVDRPLTPRELQRMATEPLVTLGNHTADHALLTVHDDGEAQAQIRSCQDYLTAVSGSAPQIIAYPDGRYDQRVLEMARAAGLRLGVIVEPRKNRLPLTATAELSIARYFLPAGPPLADECRRCRSDVQLLNLVRRLR